MLLQYWGHSFFTLTTEKGTVLATDPYGDFYQYPKRRVPADVCTVSHHHHDHDGLSCLTGAPKVIDYEGKVRPAEEIRVTGIPSFHDHHGGARRGENLLFVIETEKLRVAHLGDLGHVPTDFQIRELGRVDVLLLPVGGYYTIDAREAEQTRRLLSPRLTVPMHYRTAYDPDMPVAGVEDFLREAGAPDAERVSCLRLTAADLAQRPPVLVMDIEP